MKKCFFVLATMLVAMISVAVPLTAVAQAAAPSVPHPGVRMADLNATDRQVRHNGALAFQANATANEMKISLVDEVTRLNGELATAKRRSGGNSSRISQLKLQLGVAEGKVRLLEEGLGDCRNEARLAVVSASAADRTSAAKALELCQTKALERVRAFHDSVLESRRHLLVAARCKVTRTSSGGGASTQEMVDCGEPDNTDIAPIHFAQTVRMENGDMVQSSLRTGVASAPGVYIAKEAMRCKGWACKAVVAIGVGIAIGVGTYFVVAETTDKVEKANGVEVGRQPDYEKARKYGLLTALGGSALGLGLSFAF